MKESTCKDRIPFINSDRVIISFRRGEPQLNVGSELLQEPGTPRTNKVLILPEERGPVSKNLSNYYYCNFQK
jgi:hypothetical protein